MERKIIYLFLGLILWGPTFSLTLNARDSSVKRYAVVVSEKTLADKGWSEVVKTLEKKYNGRRFVYKNPNIFPIRRQLSAYMPYYVCIVTRPEEASRELIRQARRTMTWLDDDPYEDALWAILTGYSVQDAMRIATAEPLTLKHALSHILGGWLDWFEEGLSFSECQKNAEFIKKPGQPVKQVKGPDDTTKEMVNALNSNTYQVISSSGHASEHNWQMGYTYRDGQLVSRDGQLFGISTTGKKYKIKTNNPKIYYSPGNCLIAHISDKNCMVLAWLHNGANQFFGHIVLQGQICTAWSISSYLFGLQDRFTYAEAIYISRQVAQSFVVDKALDARTTSLYSRCLAGTILYGDPAWSARMKRTTTPWYDQDLKVKKRADGKYRITFKIKANRDVSFSHRINGGPFAFLPVNVKNGQVESTNGFKVIVADNFIHLRLGKDGSCSLKKGDKRFAVVVAEPQTKWTFLPDSKLPKLQEDIFALQDKAMQLLRKKNYKAAIKAYKLILDRFPGNRDAFYNTACAYALLGEKKQAVLFLEKAVKAGFTDIDHIINDSDLNSIRNEEGYKRIIRKQKEILFTKFDAELSPETVKGYLPLDKDVFRPPAKEVKFQTINLRGQGAIQPGRSQGETSIAWGRKSLWILSGGKVRKLNPKNGRARKKPVLKIPETGCFSVVGDNLWSADNSSVNIFSTITGKRIKQFRFKQKIATPAGIKVVEHKIATPAGLALVGGSLFVADKKARKIYRMQPGTGEKIAEFSTPSTDTTGLAAFGDYLLVSDGKDKTVYLVTRDGYVFFRVKTMTSPLGVASDGKRIWTIDRQNKLREFRIDRSRTIYLSRKRTADVLYQSINGKKTYIAVPRNLNRQKITGKVQIAPGSKIYRDNWGQPAVNAIKLKITVELYDMQYTIWPDKVGSLKDIPEDVARKYLVDGEMLKINDPAIQEGRKWITRNGKEKNCYQLVQRAYQYATKHAYYKKSGGWPPAPELLKKGTGTCSPLAFLFMSLCRASGIPARFQAGTRCRNNKPSTDKEFHRWSEVYLPGYNWVAVDSSANGKNPTPARRASFFGHVPNTDLVITIGGGGSSLFGWGYNSAADGAAHWSEIKVEK